MKQILCALIAGVWVTPALASFHIVLDPGHGGVDKGAVYNSIREADLVLTVAQRLQTLLKEHPEFTITMTREKDRAITLPERVKMAEEANADLYVSLHANAALDQRAKGVEFFFQNNMPVDEDSLYLANQENQAILNARDIHTISGGDELSKKGDIAAIVEDMRRQNRMFSSLRLTKALTTIWENDENAMQATIKQAPFYVISKTSMPAVLIEIGFISNPREAKRLQQKDYQKDLAQKIYNALVSYKEKMDNSSAKNLN
ncbi:N-acetylmuramoyl-L-alanine amidase [Bdellovibrio sp. SKB1291214]|uniref:N-acetylmuramoyl-L-alanine amidase family protein n=1 Tax=Bdellovibrio sp. SKB1291214 TaxID=1732569 RepID=UPI0020CF9856|nr:N-acetylmuramoyl-L-alanine amidase [Bdellovibrio sp. SKB1291214]UYL09477.1 N-acetylmuramoyl-L-alanine amidase [Bdellovibrio sp. SKB1291214]